ncbi:hypothetical protein DPMN_030318 [Dreissena polymorpha]|uniref:Uncharacterized protein n=1 Tax=Dreissena polymorpha TaxID=45954 RepID=A0A9D4RH03_DREPO|nr:hypothetical protein DPMN_030318 [Dreissena polymorpha]
MDTPDPSQACIQYNKAISNLEPPREMKRRRHRNTWRRDLDADAKQINNAWLQLEGT